jgi:hypothetical protein
VLEHISTAVEFACGVLGLDTQKGVVRGVLPVRGIGGTSSDFFGTGIAIVTIESSLATFTDWLANLIVSTVEWAKVPTEGGSKSTTKNVSQGFDPTRNCGLSGSDFFCTSRACQ